MTALIKSAGHNKPPCDGAVAVGDEFTIEVADLPALLDLCRRVKHDLIVDTKSYHWEPPHDFRIMIYDDYVE